MELLCAEYERLLDKEVWERVEKRAKAKGLSLHAAIRTAIIEWVGRNELR